MTTHIPWYNEEYLNKQKAKVVSVATKMLEGQIGIIEGSRLLFRLRGTVTKDDFDKDFMIFVAIVSETDHLPIGAERQYWASYALAEEDKEIADAEDFYREQALAGCRTLIERFGSAKQSSDAS